MDSIRQFGQYKPLVCRAREGKPPMVVAGNHTLMALAATGHATARVELIQCSDDEAKRINIADNRTADLATWDETALAAQLESFGDDYSGIGFTPEQAAKVMYGSMPEPGDADTSGDDGAGSWGVVVEVDTEAEQADLLTRLVGEGFKVRALIQG
jgi:ParB-like chromosome segregation protein Spo0J